MLVYKPLPSLPQKYLVRNQFLRKQSPVMSEKSFYLNSRPSWTMKNWCFQIVVLEKTLESLLDSKEIKQVSPKGNQPWMNLEGLMLKLKLQSFGHLMWRADSLEKTLMLGKIEGKRRSGQQRMRWLDSIANSKDMNLSNLQDIVEDRRA